jgi:hypothetical protein
MSKDKGGISVFTAMQKTGALSRQLKDLERMLRGLARRQGIDFSGLTKPRKEVKNGGRAA